MKIIIINRFWIPINAADKIINVPWAIKFLLWYKTP